MCVYMTEMHPGGEFFHEASNHSFVHTRNSYVASTLDKEE